MRRRSRAGGEPARTRANFAGEMIKTWDHSLGDNVNQRALSILVAAAGTLHSPSQKLVFLFATLCVCFTFATGAPAGTLVGLLEGFGGGPTGPGILSLPHGIARH